MEKNGRIKIGVFGLFICLFLLVSFQCRAADVSEAQRFLTWYEENKTTGGAFVLQQDLVIDDFVDFGNAEGEFTIDAGPYSVCLTGDANLWFNDDEQTVIHITGDGNEKGLLYCSGYAQAYGDSISLDLHAEDGRVIQMEDDSRIAVDNITVSGGGSAAGAVHITEESVLNAYGDLCVDMKHGTAILQEQEGMIGIGRHWSVKTSGGNAVRLLDEADLDYSNYSSAKEPNLLQTENASAVFLGGQAAFFNNADETWTNSIVSSGDRCIGVETEQEETELYSMDIRTNGSNSTGIKSTGSLYLSGVHVTAEGKGAVSVSPEAAVEADLQCSFSPEISDGSQEPAVYEIIDAADYGTIDAAARPGMHIKDVKLPGSVLITLTDGTNEERDWCRVIWSEESLQEGLKSAADFWLEGEFDFTEQQKERYTNPAGVIPKVKVKIRTELQMQKVKAEFIKNNGVPEQLKFSFVKPWNAEKIIFETSEDGKNYTVKKDITSILDDYDSWDMLPYWMNIKDVPQLFYARIWMDCPVYTGYTDVWKIDTVLGKAELYQPVSGEDADNSDIDVDDGGGDRGGGGTDEPDRVPNTPDQEKEKDKEEEKDTSGDPVQGPGGSQENSGGQTGSGGDLTPGISGGQLTEDETAARGSGGNDGTEETGAGSAPIIASGVEAGNSGSVHFKDVGNSGQSSGAQTGTEEGKKAENADTTEAVAEKGSGISKLPQKSPVLFWTAVLVTAAAAFGILLLFAKKRPRGK